jgi:hypothetical protein
VPINQLNVLDNDYIKERILSILTHLDLKMSAFLIVFLVEELVTLLLLRKFNLVTCGEAT